MKKNVIRAICLVLALVMGLGLVSCGGAAASGSNSDSTSQPTIDYSVGLNDNGFWKDVKALDYVTLPDYKNIEIPEEEIAASDEDVNTIKTNMTHSFGTPSQIKDRAVADGDTVYINYVGSVDGVEFNGGNTNGRATALTIGSGKYIEGFEEQLVGAMPGDTVEVKATFPEGYRDSTDKDGNTMVLAGKEAVFNTTVEYIAGETVYPEFDDNFVADNLSMIYGWKTVAEAEEGIRTDIRDTNKNHFIVDFLDANTTVSEVPQFVIDTIVNLSLDSAKSAAAMQKVDVNELYKSAGFESEEAFIEQLKEDAQVTGRQQLMIQAIAENEGIEITEDDLKEAYGDQLDSALKEYGKGYTAMTVMINNVIAMLMEEN